MSTGALRFQPEPRFRWPAGCRCAAMLCFDVDGETTALSEDPQLARRRTLMSQCEYGPRIGVPRLLGLLEHLKCRRHSSFPATSSSSTRAWSKRSSRRARDRSARLLAREARLSQRGGGRGHPDEASRFSRFTGRSPRAFARRGLRPIRGRRRCSSGTACTIARARWATTCPTLPERAGRDSRPMAARRLGAVRLQRRSGMGLRAGKLREGLRPVVARVRGDARLRLLLRAHPASLAERPAFARAPAGRARPRHAGEGRRVVCARAEIATWVKENPDARRELDLDHPN